MTRISKQGQRRAVSPRKHRLPSPKSGPKKDLLEHGYRVHHNALTEANNRFIPKMGRA